MPNLLSESDDQDTDEVDDLPIRRNGRNGFPIWAGFAIGGAVLFLMCGGAGILAFRVVAKSVAARNATTVVPFQQETRIGDLGIAVTSASVDGYYSTSPSGTLLCHQPQLLVHLSIRNANPNKIHTVRGQALSAEVEDNFGQCLGGIQPRAEFGIISRANGQIPPYGAASVRSETPVTDLLILDVPVAGATSVVVTLDAYNYGGTGKLRTLIGRCDWEPKPQAPVEPPVRPVNQSRRKN